MRKYIKILFLTLILLSICFATNVYASDTVLVDEEQAELVKFEEADGWIIEEYYHLDVDFQLKKK